MDIKQPDEISEKKSDSNHIFFRQHRWSDSDIKLELEELVDKNDKLS
jgi:hypothetical protein